MFEKNEKDMCIEVSLYHSLPNFRAHRKLDDEK